MTSKWICDRHELAFVVGEPCIYCEDLPSRKSTTDEFLSVGESFTILTKMWPAAELEPLSPHEAVGVGLRGGYVIASYEDLGVELHRYNLTRKRWEGVVADDDLEWVGIEYNPENPEDYEFFVYPFSSFPIKKDEV